MCGSKLEARKGGGRQIGGIGDKRGGQAMHRDETGGGAGSDAD